MKAIRRSSPSSFRCRRSWRRSKSASATARSSNTWMLTARRDWWNTLMKTPACRAGCISMLAERSAMPSRADAKNARALGVKIEAEYIVGEYDILILSAEESDGLETWLKQNGYNIPNGASRILESYIKQKMRFFVAR